MATTSTIPTVKAALVTALSGRTNLATVHVVYAWDGQAMPAEAIFLDPPEATHRTNSTIPVMRAGRKSREEAYTVVAVVQVIQDGGTANAAATTEARAFALLAELENTLADDPTLSNAGGVTTRMSIANYERRLTPAGSGWMSRIDVDIDCRFRLA